MRRFFHFSIDDTEAIRQGALAIADRYEEAVLLDSNGYSPHRPGMETAPTYDMMLALGRDGKLSVKTGNAFDALQAFHDEQRDWLFGFLSYELKNELEDLASGNVDRPGFPALCFIRPAVLILLKGGELQIGLLNGTAKEAEGIVRQLKQAKTYDAESISVPIQQGMSKEEYIKAVAKLQGHIRRGDIYESNFCMDFFVEKMNVPPIDLYGRLRSLSPSPFGGYFRSGPYAILSASPERFLKKDGRQLISQPMKGTRPRGDDTQANERALRELKTSPKEQAENHMIVDLVRNDLSRVAVPGSVQVLENCGVHPYGNVFQMISSIGAEMEEGLSFTEAIKATFPMGSMTGAPKLRAMQLAEKHEAFMRGPYSGALGYITPEGDFDFNVLIRSIFVNQGKKVAVYPVGSAITALADAEAEYEECLWKARAFFGLFS